MLRRVLPLLLLTCLPAVRAQHVVDVNCCQFTDSISGNTHTVVPVGTTIKWQFGGFVPHTVTSGTGSSDPASGGLFNANLNTGNTVFLRTFNTPGFFPYYCQIHEFVPMSGDILVTVPAISAQVGAGCGGATLTTTGVPAIGNSSFAFNVSGGPAGGSASLFIAATTTTSPLFIGPPNCLLYLDLNSLLAFISIGISPFGPPITLSGGGSGSFPFAIPPLNSLMAIQFAAQVLVFFPGSGSFVVTDARNLQVGV